MNLQWIARVVFPCAIIAVSPALVRLIAEGVKEEKIEVDDCKKTGGKMGTELVSHPSPIPLAVVPAHEVKDGDHVHARFSIPATTVDATTSAKVAPKLEFAPGSNLGNATGNIRKFETQSPWSKSPVSDEAQIELKATCTDCTYGQWQVGVKQTVSLKISVIWQPASVTPAGTPLGVPNQVPEWDILVGFSGITAGLLAQQLSVSAYPTTAGVMETTAYSSNDSMKVSLFGLPPFEGESLLGEDLWTSNPWSADARYQIEVTAEWADTWYHVFSCQDHAGSDPIKDLEVHAKWPMAIEDKTTPQFPYTDGILSHIAANLEYVTDIWIDRITVMKNCDQSNTNCPCDQYPKE